jgi:hypothetical protein
MALPVVSHETALSAARDVATKAAAVKAGTEDRYVLALEDNPVLMEVVMWQVSYSGLNTREIAHSLMAAEIMYAALRAQSEVDELRRMANAGDTPEDAGDPTGACRVTRARLVNRQPPAPDCRAGKFVEDMSA